MPEKSTTGRAQVSRDGAKSPRLPHEHDESSDIAAGAPRDVMRRAKEDIDGGKQQTDRGEATDAAYRRQKR
jgi:hypothetical protein